MNLVMKYSSNPNQQITQIKTRKAKLKNMIVQQIKIAKRLDQIEGSKSLSAVHAWDVVEELSRKITRLEHLENDLEADLESHYIQQYDEFLSLRNYDV